MSHVPSSPVQRHVLQVQNTGHTLLSPCLPVSCCCFRLAVSVFPSTSMYAHTASADAGGLSEALFVYKQDAGCYWYNTRLQLSVHAQQQYQVAGWLAGQGLHNRAVLGIRLAPLLWQKLLEGDQFKASTQQQSASRHYAFPNQA